MFPPKKLKFEAAKKEKQNMRFRTFLKINADPDELDRQFAQLHKELFASYDCAKCRNCCKNCSAELDKENVKEAAEYLGLTEEEFIERYLEKTKYGLSYQTRNMPCDFLLGDGECLLGDCKPEGCKNYPFTDQPDRLARMYSVLDATFICPVVFEIIERLKKMYDFH